MTFLHFTIRDIRIGKKRVRASGRAIERGARREEVGGKIVIYSRGRFGRSAGTERIDE